jgi:hypothetical protein
MGQYIVQFFNHPFFIVLGGIATLFSVIGVVVVAVLVIRGVFPVWYRLGLGLSNRKIAVFANSEFEALKSMLVDSKLFREKNIVRIDKKELKKAQPFSLLLVHWKPFASEMDSILSLKRDNAALIIYAPQNEGFVDKEMLEKINIERNAIIVNFRGRLLNDILTSMITTSYD